MAHEVYANNLAIVSKSADGKSICAFPDVCLSPPSPPAGPIPIPYPNTGFASDTTSGSKSVKLKGKEVCLKNKSYFSKSTGDEAATKTLGMAVITHQITGKVYFNSWSMDVKVEGENVCRFGDLTTHNHMSPPGNSPPWAYLDRMALAQGLAACESDKDKAEKACGDLSQKAKCPSNDGIKSAVAARRAAKAAAGDGFEKDEGWKNANAQVRKEYENLAVEVNKDECHKALRCFLAPYRPNRCCPGQTGHHLVEASSFFDVGRGGEGSTPEAGCEQYKAKDAPCICAEGPDNTTATHGMMHTFQGNASIKTMNANGSDRVSYKQAKDQGCDATAKVFKESGCSKACLEAQLDKYHNSKGITDTTSLRGSPSGRTSDADVAAANAKLGLNAAPAD